MSKIPVHPRYDFSVPDSYLIEDNLEVSASRKSASPVHPEPYVTHETTVPLVLARRQPGASEPKGRHWRRRSANCSKCDGLLPAVQYRAVAFSAAINPPSVSPKCKLCSPGRRYF